MFFQNGLKKPEKPEKPGAVVGKRSIDNVKSETRLSSDICGDPVQLTDLDSQEDKEMAVRVLDSLKTDLDRRMLKTHGQN
jgi:hypothetical protein